jgi:hypothetical protein
VKVERGGECAAGRSCGWGQELHLLFFSSQDQEFARLFPDREDVAFIDEALSRPHRDETEALLAKLWSHPVLKSAARGICGTLFYELDVKKKYHPTRKKV